MKRLLRISVLALACCAACTALARPRLAFHAYAVRDLCEKDFPSVLKAAKEMGFDPGWCVIAGEDAMAWLAAHPHRNKTVHVMPAIRGTFPAGECGVGSPHDEAPWGELVEALAKDGVEWFVVKPVAHPETLADLKASIDYLKPLLQQQ